jgi:hypothetical protein
MEPDELLGRVLRYLNAGDLGQADALFRSCSRASRATSPASTGWGLAANLAGKPAAAAMFFRARDPRAAGQAGVP